MPPRSNSPALDQLRHHRRRLGLHARNDVCVLLQCERWRLVPEPLSDHLHRHAGPQSDRRMRVPQIMKANPRQPAPCNQPVEHLREQIWMHTRPVLSAEHEVVIAILGAPCRPLITLRRTMRGKGVIHIVNHGTEAAFGVDLEIPAEPGVSLITSDLPIDELPVGKSVGVPLVQTMGGGKRHFKVKLTARTADGTDVEQDGFVDLLG